MKFEDIEQDMLISYDERLFLVVEYSVTTTLIDFWQLEAMDFDSRVFITKNDSRLPRLSIFEIEELLEL